MGEEVDELFKELGIEPEETTEKDSEDEKTEGEKAELTEDRVREIVREELKKFYKGLQTGKYPLPVGKYPYPQKMENSLKSIEKSIQKALGENKDLTLKKSEPQEIIIRIEGLKESEPKQEIEEKSEEKETPPSEDAKLNTEIETLKATIVSLKADIEKLRAEPTKQEEIKTEKKPYDSDIFIENGKITKK